MPAKPLEMIECKKAEWPGREDYKIANLKHGVAGRSSNGAKAKRQPFARVTDLFAA